MSQNIIELYEPLNIPKVIDEDIWIVDGPRSENGNVWNICSISHTHDYYPIKK